MNTDQKISNQVRQLMLQNRRHSGRYHYTVPSPNSYPFQWFWDSCFHAIILSHFDTVAAKQEILALASKQFKNGMIPHMIYWEDPHKFTFPLIPWGKRRTSSIIQPPMLAYAVWAIYQKDRDKNFLKKMLPVIHALHAYFLRIRDPHKHNLVGLIHPDESGEDNSPRFDSVLQLQPKQTIDANYHRRLILINNYKVQHFRVKQHMERFHWVRDVPINSIFVVNLLYESQIAGELNYLEQATRARQKSEEVAAAMRKYMLEGCVMWSTVGLNYHHIKIKTWAMFAPLFANILTPNEADELVNKHFKNKKEFSTRYTIPTVSLDEKAFDPHGFWRGPVWFSTNWFLYLGLLNYGYEQEATKILNHSLQLLDKHGFREQFNPLTGEPMGAENFTWGGLILDMLAKQKSTHP